MLKTIIAAGLCLSATASLAAPAAKPVKPKAAPAPAQTAPLRPLDFLGFTASTTQAQVADKITCLKYSPSLCALVQPTVGNMTIRDSYVHFSKSGKIWNISIKSDRYSVYGAVELFTEKYGKPVTDKAEQKLNAHGGPYEQRIIIWSFADGADIYMRAGEKQLDVNFSWPQNSEPVEKRKVDF